MSSNANDTTEEHAAVCSVCDFREEAADYIAATLLVDRHEEKTGHEVDVLPVTFETSNRGG
ncbi:MAG: hypothetical protein U5J64_11080 [Halobacteriales archaeon]|nr:hypothetical protein [Halobacteriales archaeon]